MANLSVNVISALSARTASAAAALALVCFAPSALAGSATASLASASANTAIATESTGELDATLHGPLDLREGQDALREAKQ